MTLILDDYFSETAGKTGPEDRPYYNNLLALQCELSYAIDRDLTAEQFVQKHIQNWNFDQRFDWVQETRFEHEFAHMLLGLCFPIIGCNPFPFEFGYNGNNMSEVFVVSIEHYMKRPKKIKDGFGGDSFLRGIFIDYDEEAQADDAKNNIAAALFLRDDENRDMKSIFNIRRELRFNPEAESDVYDLNDRDMLALECEIAEDIYKPEDVDPFIVMHIRNIITPFMMSVHEQSKPFHGMKPKVWKKALPKFLRQLKVKDINRCLREAENKFEFRGIAAKGFIPSP